MNCHDFNADTIPIDGSISPDIMQQIREMQKCGKCAQCLYTYIMLAPTMSDKELVEVFGADLLEQGDLKDDLGLLAGLRLNPYPNPQRIARVNKALQRICLQKERSNKVLIKHYINECLRQLEGDMLEEYFNMSP
jgi:hypothetical protein